VAINTFRVPDRNGREAIAVVLSPDSIYADAEGQPCPGVVLYIPQAREIAHRLLLFAQEIENGRPISFHSSGRTQREPDEESLF
jgi:hypothetical protein